MKPRRSFSENFAEGLRVSANKRGWRAFIPYVLGICSALGATAAFYFPDVFWTDTNWGVSATVYVGFVTFNALLLAFSQNAFLKIQDTVSTGTIGHALAKQGLLDETLFAVEFNQAILAISSAASACGLISVILPLGLIEDRIVIGATLALSLYALTKSYVATREMNAFIWERVHSEIESQSPSHPIPFPTQQGNGSR
jgi:hypothetical protein